MGDSTGVRGFPAKNDYTHGGIQSKSQLNAQGNMLSRLSVDGGDIYADRNGVTISVPRSENDGKHHFQGVKDTTYEPTGSDDRNRRIAIRSGLFGRASAGFSELTISATSPSNFSSQPDPSVDKLSICNDTIADGVTWCVYLALYNSSTGDYNAVNPDTLVAQYAVSDPEDYTVGRPTDPETDNILDYCRVLFYVTNTNGNLSFSPEHEASNIKDFVMIPDGKPQTESGQWIAGLDYVEGSASDLQDGLLQDSQAHQDLITASDITNIQNDYALQYYDYSTSALTQKKYARVDSANSGSVGSGFWGATNAGKSLEIETAKKIIQLYQFLNINNGQDLLDATLQSGADDGDIQMLCRLRNDTDGPELRYYDFSSMIVYQAYDLVPGTVFAHNDLFDMADVTGSNMDHNYAYLRRYDTAGDLTYENDAEYRNKGSIYSTTLGLADSVTGAPDTDNDWSLAGFKYLMTNGAKLVADTDHTFEAGKVIISDVFGATGAGSGSLQVPNGGASFGVGMYSARASASWAGKFEESGVSTVEFCNGTDAITADGLNIALTNGVYEHASNEGISTDSGFSGGILYDEDLMNGNIDSRYLNLSAQGF